MGRNLKNLAWGPALAIAYVVTGEIGLLFAPGTGYATALFLPAGIALAAVLVRGGSSLVWIGTGALVLNLIHGQALNVQDSARMTVALGIACISTCQAWFAGHLLRRWVGLPLMFDSGAKAIRFAGLAIATCLFGSALAVSLLLASKLVSLGDLPMTWMTWWIGDSLGMVLATPLLLMLTGAAGRDWHDGRRKLGIVLSCGLLLTGIVANRVGEIERDRTMADFHLLSQQVGDQFAIRFSELEGFVGQLAAVMEGSNRMGRDDFYRISGHALKRFNVTLQAIEWAPEIHAAQRQDFERSHFDIRERNTQGQMQKAVERPSYLPVTYLDPKGGNEVALGFDLMSNAMRRTTIEKARQLQIPLATAPLQLVQEHDSQKGVLLVHWVSGGGNGAGLVLIVLRMGDFLKGVTGDMKQHLMVRLIDLDAESFIIFDSFTNNTPARTVTRSIEAGGRHYQMVTAPTSAYLQSHRDWQGWIVAVGGLSLLGTINLFLVIAYTRQENIQQLVEERTREFEESRQEVQKAGDLLREAVASITQGFTIYDENDRLVICNETYKQIYEDSRDLIVPGNTFEEIVRTGAERGQYQEASGRIDEWVRERVRQHQSASGEAIEQQLGNGRWLLIVEHRTPSGYIVGNRIDITDLKRTAEALRERELYLRATLDNLPFFFWLKDTEGRFLAVNKVFAEACGRGTPDKVVGLTDLDVWPRELADRYRADDAAVMTSRTDKAVEEPVAGGSEAGWIETYKKPVIGDDGALLGTVGFARDISDRKKIERALSESEQRWALAVQGTNDGIWDWNIADGTVYFSERWLTMLGYRAGDLAGRLEEWHDMLHPDDALHVQQDLERHLGGETEFYEIEFRLRCKDGSYKWILGRGKAMFDEQGRAVRMAGSHTDITGRREAEARVRDRTGQLNAIFDLSPDGFLSFDRSHRVSFVSPAFMRLTGFGSEELVGLDEQGFSKLLSGASIESARFPGIEELRARQKAAGKDDGYRRQLIEMTGAGKRILEIGLRESGTDTVSQILYVRDVTHETEVDRMKSEFLSTAAHELRTPMASIYGFAELLIHQEFDDDSRKELLATIYGQATQMVSIINELLDLARIEARRGKDFKLEPIEVGALLQQVTAGFRPTDGRLPPILDCDSVPVYVRADRNKLTQAIGNVLSNAYKYSPAGGEVSITLAGAHDEEKPAQIGISIHDHGIGMTKQQLQRVCERFYRADTSGKIPGTGLGMSIVKEIVELHGGRIDIDSLPAQGSTVTLWLPRLALASAGMSKGMKP